MDPRIRIAASVLFGVTAYASAFLHFYDAGFIARAHYGAKGKEDVRSFIRKHAA